MTEQEQLAKIDGRGRPQSLKTQELIADLQMRLKVFEDAQTETAQMRELAELVRVLMRAIKGQDADDNVFLGLTNVDDIRERTRLDETSVLSHSAMRIAATKWPRLELFEDIANMEDPYYISQDGEGRREALLTVQAKTKMDGNMILNMPNTQGGIAQTEQPQAQQPQKKNLFQRIFKR